MHSYLAPRESFWGWLWECTLVHGQEKPQAGEQLKDDCSLKLMVHVPYFRFEVPADKVDYALQWIQEAIGSTTACKVASRAHARVVASCCP